MNDMPRTSRRLAEMKRVELDGIFRRHHKVVCSQHFKHLEECNRAHFLFCGHSRKVGAAINVSITENICDFKGFKSGLPVTHSKCDILVQQGLASMTFPHLDGLLIKQ